VISHGREAFMAKKANILIIEDDRDLVNSMRVIFEANDY